jgi:phage-related protein (TIGR01555 family)
VWKAIDILVTDANQAVYSIAGLWRMIVGDPTQGQDSVTSNGAGKPSGALLNRIRFMDFFRSVSRAIVLDKDDETFERKPTTFTGLPELSERQWVRVSAAFDIPLPLLTGEYPSGLQSTGEGPFRVFYANVASRQEEDFGPKILDVAKLLLQADGAPELTDEQFVDLEIEWLPLWEPTAAELSTMRLQRAQADDLYVANQTLTPEEVALSLPEEWYTHVDRDLRAEHTDKMTEVPSVTAANQEADAAKLQADALAKAKADPGVPAGKAGPPATGKGGGTFQAGAKRA